MALTRAPAIEKGLNFAEIYFMGRRTTIYNDSHRAAMGFSKGRNAKEVAESVCHKFFPQKDNSHYSSTNPGGKASPYYLPSLLSFALADQRIKSKECVHLPVLPNDLTDTDTRIQFYAFDIGGEIQIVTMGLDRVGDLRNIGLKPGVAIVKEGGEIEPLQINDVHKFG